MSVYYFKNILRSILHPKVYGWVQKKWHKLIRKYNVKVSGTKKDWKVYIDDCRIDQALKEMMLLYENSKEEVAISAYWKELNNKNIIQLIELGFENFKQTVALNYFTWLLKENDTQVEFLKQNLSSDNIIWAREKAKTSTRHSLFTYEQSVLYNFITFMLWEFTKQQGNQKICDILCEPLIGNPPVVNCDGKLISQDLANSILEYQSICAGIKNFNDTRNILEIGAGYGRTAYVILALNSNIRYIIADVPPALYVSQKYLSQVFPEKKIFRFRNFRKFSEIEKEFYASDIIFLMPSQLKKLPNKSIDLCLAIDCLHEMLPGQIDFYFKIFDRLAKNFYFKCWKKTTIPYDEIILIEKDYPVCPNWKKLYWKECKVQSAYFEAFFSLETDFMMSNQGGING